MITPRAIIQTQNKTYGAKAMLWVQTARARNRPTARIILAQLSQVGK
jgi:hypothetical protein